MAKVWMFRGAENILYKMWHYFVCYIEFHTFQILEERTLRVVILNFHPSTPTENIKTELEELDYILKQVSLQGGTKEAS